MKKKSVLVLVILLAIGFASISTSLIINGTIGIGSKIDDFDVIFTSATIDGEESSNAVISEDKKKITFSSRKLTMLNEITVLDYKVKNNSTQYNADVTITCNNTGNDYINITGEFDGKNIPLTNPVNMSAQEIKDGFISAKLVKAYTGEDTSFSIICEINNKATSRDDFSYTINFDSNGGNQVEDKIVSSNGTYGELPIPEKDDFVFLGWYDEDGNKIDNNATMNKSENITLHAKWTPVCTYDLGKTWNFNYTGSEQLFKAPCLGNYQVEVWGAQGGASNSTYIGGYGGYSTGIVTLDYDTNAYINVGGMGVSSNTAYSSVGAKGGYNGGGKASPNTGVNHIYGSGGGATHIALKSGILSTLANSVDKIIIVAGGGGGGRWQTNYNEGAYGYGGHGGGYIGVRSSVKGGNKNGPFAGSQSFVSGAGTFGQGANNTGGSAAGGGFYGGGVGNTGGGPASGGSGYIGNPLLTNKVMYCYDCTASNEEDIKTVSTTCVSSTPTANCAKQSGGYARITLVGLPY